jgi:hypothetical protein
MPISRMIPISAMMLSSMRRAISASNAPTPADGSVDRIVIGWIRLSYRIPSTMYTASNAAAIRKASFATDS